MDAAVEQCRRLELHQASGGAHRLTPPSVSLVIPAYNEQEVIERAIREADEALSALVTDYEIIVVDDGSVDGTRERAQLAADTRPRVRVIRHAGNRGYGAALRTGFQAATKSYVGFTDADCQFDLRELERLILLLRGHEIACGYRIDRQDHWLRGVYSKSYNLLVRTLLRTRVRDCDCALKLFRRQTLQSLPITTNGFLVNAELLAHASLQGLSVVEVGVTHRPRCGGTSKVSPLHAFPVLWALLRFWWATILFPAPSRHADSTSAGTRPEDDSRWRPMLPAVGLSLLAGLMLFGNLSYPFFEPDESRYAQIALEMVQSGDYLVPRLLGEPYLDKPPLLYWVTAASFRLMGPSEFAARFPGALAAMLTVLATSLLGGRWLGARAAYLGALMLFLCLGFVLAGRFLIMDGLLTFFTTVGLLASFLAIARPSTVAWRWWLLGAVATSLGVMTKGPVAFLLVGPPVAAYHWLEQRSVLTLRHWFVFVLIGLSLAGPWFAAIAWRQENFAVYFLWEHHVLRFFTEYNHVQPFWFYVPVLLIGMFPGSLLAGPVLAFLLGRSAALRQQRPRELGAMVLTGLWIVTFFSLSSCKLPTYVLPAVPFFCLVQGAMVAGWLRSSFHFPTWGAWVARIPLEAATAALLTGSIIAVTDLWLVPDVGLDRTANLAVLAVTIAFLAYRLCHRGPWPAHVGSWAAAAATCLLMIAFAFQNFVPELAGYRSINANAARLQTALGGKPIPVVFLNWRTDGSAFYLRPNSIRSWSVDKLPRVRRFVTEHPRFLVVANPSDAAVLRAELGQPMVVDRSPGARGRLFVFSTASYPNGPTPSRVAARPPNST